MQRITMTLQPRLKRSEVIFGTDLLFSESIVSEIKPLASRFALFCDDRMAKILGEKWASFLKKSGLEVCLFSFPQGEKEKTRARKAELEDLLFSQKFNRDVCLIALGGGVVTDLIGFLAATFCRGVALVNVPTTLLGMVDAAIGGKTAVNTSLGKNLIGAFYPAEKILIDPVVLKSLPPQEWTNGCAEMIKYALIHSQPLFESLKKWAPENLKYLEPVAKLHGSEKSMILDPVERSGDARPISSDGGLPRRAGEEELTQQGSKGRFCVPKSFAAGSLEQTIYECLEIKTQIVEADYEETSGLRRILNFGHTIGHAVEHVENYHIPHGEAVALGMLVESYLSLKMNLLSEEAFAQIEQLIRAFPFKLRLSPHTTEEKIFETLVLDKKAKRSSPRFVLLTKIGACHPFQGEYCREAPLPLLKEALHWMMDSFGEKNG